MLRSLKIRRLVADDLGAWEPLWRAYLDFYRAEVSDEITRATFGRLTAETGALAGFVAEADQGLVGLAHLVFHASTWSSASYCYLEDLFVSPAARGTSAARELMTATYEEADRRGATRTYWQTQQYNGPARSLYDQVGHVTSFIVYER